VSHLFTPAEQPGLAEEITMMATGTDVTRDRVAAYPFPRGGVEVVCSATIWMRSERQSG
jgi:hypothetical protein